MPRIAGSPSAWSRIERAASMADSRAGPGAATADRGCSRPSLLLRGLRGLAGLQPPRLLAAARPIVLVELATGVDGEPDGELGADRLDVVVVQARCHHEVAGLRMD